MALKPLPVYRYSSSLEKRVGLMLVATRSMPGSSREPERLRGDGERETSGTWSVRDWLSERADWAGKVPIGDSAEAT